MKLFRNTITSRFILGLVVFIGIFIFLAFERINAKEISVPLYLIEDNGNIELFIDKSNFNNYDVEDISISSLSSDENIKVSVRDKKFFIDKELKNNSEYVCEIKLSEKNTTNRVLHRAKFKYFKNNVYVRNIKSNSCEVIVSYDNKNSIFIDNIELYVSEFYFSGNYDFVGRRGISRSNSYRNNIAFRDISLRPDTDYNFCVVTKSNNDVNFVQKKRVKTDKFEILNVVSRMVGNREIKLEWEVSDKDLKLLDKDSIKIYVKRFGDTSYSTVPIVKITEGNVFSVVVDSGKISPDYEVKISYDFAGKRVEKIIQKINDFYAVDTKLSINKVRNLKLKFKIDNKFKAKNNEILNIYLSEINNEFATPKKIFSGKINDISFTPYYTLNFNELKPDTHYRLSYKVRYDDNTEVMMKEDEFKTSLFEFKTFNVSSSKDEQENLKVKFKWQLLESGFEFLEGDALSIYIKNKDVSNYSDKPYFYKNSNLDDTFFIEFEGKDINGSYDIKFVYTINGKDFIEHRSLYVNSNPTKLFSKNLSMATTEQPESEKKNFNVTVKDTRVNEVVFELSYPEKFVFTDGDNLSITANNKANNSKKVELNFIHSSTEEQGKVDLKTMTTVTVDGLESNKDYKFDVVLKSKNDPNDVKNDATNGSTGSEDSDNDSSSSDSSDLEGSEGTEDNLENGSTEEGNNSGNQESSGSQGDSSDSSDQLPDESEEDSEEEEGSGDGALNEDDDATEEDNSSQPNLPNDSIIMPSEPNGGETEVVENRKISLFNGSNGLKETTKTIDNIKTHKFEILTLEMETIRTNSAVLKWTITDKIANFGENDKVQIFVKRKIVGGYPAGSSFTKLGEEIKDVLSGEVVVQYMEMDYDAKLVYTISGEKFEKVVQFKTIKDNTSCLVEHVNQYSVTLNIKYPKDYKFRDNSAVEIYIKNKGDKSYPKDPVVTLLGDEDLETKTSVQILGLSPQLSYDALVKVVTKSNDVPDCTTSFATDRIVLKNCRIVSMNDEKVRVKTDLENYEDLLEYIEFYVDVFYKLSDSSDYLDDILFSGFRKEALDFEFVPKYKYRDLNFLVSFNPHGFFSDTLFLEFELEYKTLRLIVNEREIEEENVKKKTYNLEWAYPYPVDLGSINKINIYLKELSEDELIQGPEEGKKDGYTLVHTISSNFEVDNKFNLDYFISEGKKYRFMVEIESDEFKAGPSIVDFEMENKVVEGEVPPNGEDEVIDFEVPVVIEETSSEGDILLFNMPQLKGVELTPEMDISCDIDGLSFEYIDEKVNVKGLIPGKNYELIEIKIKVEEGKELKLNIENIKLDIQEEVQQFLLNVYDRAFLRSPDEGGYKYWMDRLKNKDISARMFLINLLFAEKEFSEMDYKTDQFITVLYSIIVNREPDTEGLNFWINFYNEDALKNSNNDVFVAKQYIVDRMINEKEFEKLIVGMGLEY